MEQKSVQITSLEPRARVSPRLAAAAWQTLVHFQDRKLAAGTFVHGYHVAKLDADLAIISSSSLAERKGEGDAVHTSAELDSLELSSSALITPGVVASATPKEMSATPDNSAVSATQGAEAVVTYPRLAALALAGCGVAGACYLLRNYFSSPSKS